MSNSVPDGWNECSLKDVSTIVTKGTTPTTYGSGYVHSGIKFIRVENILKSGFIDESDLKFIDAKTHESLKRSQLHLGDLLVSIAGAIGRSAVVNAQNLPANTNQAVGIVRLRINEILPNFARYSIESPVVAKQISDSQAGNAQVNLNLEQLGGLRLYRPPLPEQQKITTILSSVDDVIEKTRAQIDKLKDLKTGMMQELLTKGIGSGGVPHTEFKDSPVGRIPVGWDIVPLEKFSLQEKNSFVNGPFGSDLLSSELTDSGVPVIYVRDLKRSQYKRVSTVCVTEEKADSLIACNVVKGDVVIAKVGDPPCGSGVYDDDKRSIVTQDVIRIRPKTSVYSNYLSYMLNSPMGKKQIQKIEITGTRRRVSLTEFKKLLFPMPSHEEQVVIGTSIRSIDVQIENIERKKYLLLETKKALLQDLLTGKVRVKTDQRESVVA
ncbi:type I restriction enzyme S subunit [Marinobacter sp. LV10R520-4]|uniref:restriction endonuclease subunit S n=1 Tax=Marinobacter sp. LV10R520-4 TaxID=1761796 RepID=UPI000BF790FF|nr:restriction endonuclease subunit S [Marinobacter sp. LV10R520-4]PFG53092.1 type I restriction enzyme S subunit [Marinobacter sp. LV10R520-4]